MSTIITISLLWILCPSVANQRIEGEAQHRPYVETNADFFRFDEFHVYFVNAFK